VSDIKPAAYLGDALYARFVNEQIELRANDPNFPTDIVYLEEGVFKAFLEFAKTIGWLK